MDCKYIKFEVGDYIYIEWTDGYMGVGRVIEVVGNNQYKFTRPKYDHIPNFVTLGGYWVKDAYKIDKLTYDIFRALI